MLKRPHRAYRRCGASTTDPAARLFPNGNSHESKVCHQGDRRRGSGTAANVPSIITPIIFRSAPPGNATTKIQRSPVNIVWDTAAAVMSRHGQCRSQSDVSEFPSRGRARWRSVWNSDYDALGKPFTILGCCQSDRTLSARRAPFSRAGATPTLARSAIRYRRPGTPSTVRRYAVFPNPGTEFSASGVRAEAPLPPTGGDGSWSRNLCAPRSGFLTTESLGLSGTYTMACHLLQPADGGTAKLSQYARAPLPVRINSEETVHAKFRAVERF
jgi:hypothetical protein